MAGPWQAEEYRTDVFHPHPTTRDLKPQFEERCAAIVQDSCDSGYGFHDVLTEMFEQFLGVPDA